MPEPAAPEITEAQAGTRRPVRTVQLEPRDRAARRAEWEAVSAEPRAAACARATPTACSMSMPVAAVFVSPRRIPFRRQLRAARSAARPRRACASRGTAAKGASPRARAVMCLAMAAVATSCAAGSARLSERAATILAAPRPSRSGDCPCARSQREHDRLDENAHPFDGNPVSRHSFILRVEPLERWRRRYGHGR